MGAHARRMRRVPLCAPVMAFQWRRFVCLRTKARGFLWSQVGLGAEGGVELG